MTVDNHSNLRPAPSQPVRLGRFSHWGGDSPLLLDDAARGQHLYAVGQTGVGKSSLLLNLAIQDMERGSGVGILDPHGDIAAAVLDHVPRWRSNDVIHFDLADPESVPAFNWLNCHHPSRRPLMVSGIVSAMKAVWRDNFGPRMEQLLNASLLALAEADNTTVLGVTRLLVDECYRARILRQVRDPFVLQYWHGEFASYDKRFVSELVSPVLNKIGAILLSPPLRAAFGQVRSKFDFRNVLDRGRILIASLPKGKLGEDKASLAGSMVMSALFDAALSRVDVPVDQRRPFSLFVDELPSFANDRLDSMLSESRKLGLRLGLFHQHLQQLSPITLAGVLGNVGTIAAFRLGEADADLLARHLGDDVAASQLVDLPNHHAIVRTLHDGQRGAAAVVQTDGPPPVPRRNRKPTIIELSRRRYGTSRAVVDAKLRRWARLSDQ